jgi:RHS repeat-associated protein
VDHFNPQVLDANDYYPFGSIEPGRTYAAASVGGYRYGFNGKEDDNEVKGVGDQQDYGMRIYDPRVGRFLSVDPISNKYPELTPYQFASNTPLQAIDLDGLEGTEAADYSSHFQQQIAIEKFSASQAAVRQTNAQKNATKIDIRHPKPSPMPAKSDATSTAPTVPSDMTQLLRPGQLPKFVPRDQGTVSAPDPRSQYTPEEWGLITAPTTQLSIGMMVPGYNLTVGIGVFGKGIMEDNNIQASVGLLSMLGEGLNLKSGNFKIATGTVWDQINPTQENYPGTILPKSFELSTGNGSSVWVHPNASEHIAEYLQSQANKLSSEGLNLATQLQLTSLQEAVKTATKSGIKFDQIIQVGGWELKFSAPRQEGQLPVLMHALQKN